MTPSDDVASAHKASPSRSARRLWLYGAGMLIPELYFVLRYPLPGNVRLSDLGHMSGYGVAGFTCFLGGVGLLFVLYVLALREVRRLAVRTALPAVFGCAVVLSLVMAWMYPVTAIDVFFHVVWSHLFTTYGSNPIAVWPMDFASDPLIHRFAGGGWAGHSSPYGPLWHLLVAPITLFSGDRVGLALVGFKTLAVISLLAGGWVIYCTLAVSRPNDAATGALFFLWNPLVLWEIAGNGHNDATMILPLLLAFLAWVRRRDSWVIPLLVTSALIKYSTVLLVPVAAIALWRRAGSWSARLRLLLSSAALSALIVLVALYPFYDLYSIRLSIEDTGNIFLVSPANMVVGLLKYRYDPQEVRHWTKLIGVAILLATLACQSIAVWKRPSHLPRAAFEVFFVFLLAVTWYFQGWYTTWPLAIAALLPWGWPAWRMVAWTAGSMAAYAVFIWVRAWWVPDGTVLLRYGIATIFAAALLLTLAEVVSHLASRGRRLNDAASGALDDPRLNPDYP